MLWSEKYETGNKVVDSEHRQIFDLVQKVLDATFENRRDKMDTVMDFLVNYTVSHFENEERLMEESNYPDIAVHKKQHADFLAEVGKLKEQIAIEENHVKNNLIINKTVVGWLTNHVLGSDMLIAKYYRKWENVYKRN